MNDAEDGLTQRFRALLDRRHFVDRETGVLLVWVPVDPAVRRDLADLVPQVEARHPAARVSLQEAGAAVAVRMTAREQDLAELEALYLLGPAAD